MGLVTTTGKYCFIECDGPSCSRKIEHIDPEQLKELVKLCGWKRRGDQWVCPACAAKFYVKAPVGSRKTRTPPQRAKTGTSR